MGTTIELTKSSSRNAVGGVTWTIVGKSTVVASNPEVVPPIPEKSKTEPSCSTSARDFISILSR